MYQRAVFVVTVGMHGPDDAPERLCDQLGRQLSRLGHDHAAFVSCDDIPPEQPARHDTVIALIGDPSRAGAELAACAARRPGARFLGLMTREVDWQPELVAVFDQIAGYPCQTGELGFRIQELGRDADVKHPVGSELFLRQSLLGHSPLFLDVLDLIRRYGPVDAPVLIEGETGTGKELTARALHQLSRRADGPWVPVNCGAIPDTLFEAEMFGFEKGAFTDARQSRSGLVALAAGGTLFLDEVECLTDKGQVSLLRFLQSYEFRPIGGKEVLRADVRVVAATNQALEELVLDGQFREDLYYRLDILHIDLPPLRLRADDVLLLAQHFLRRYASRYDRPAREFSAPTRDWLRGHAWPGNARELDNVVHRAVLASEGSTVDWTPGPHNGTPDAQNGAQRFDELFDLPFGEAKSSVVNEFERQYLGACLTETHGNVSAAAARAGKHRRAFDRLLQKHQIDKSTYR